MARLFASASSQYLKQTTNSITSGTVTWACWFKITSGSGPHWLTGSGDDNDATWLHGIDAYNGNIRAFWKNTNSCSTSNSYSVGSWHHACGVVASGNQKAYLDADDANKGTNSGTGTITDLDNITIGALDRITTGSYCNGAIAEVGMWQGELTLAEITALASGISPIMIRPDIILRYFPLGGIVANNDVNDRTGNTSLTEINSPTTTEHPSGIVYPESPTFALTTPDRPTSPVGTLYEWMATDLQPLETNAATHEIHALTTVKIPVAAFDNSTEEYLNGTLRVPNDLDTTGTVTFSAGVLADTAAASSNIAMTFGHRPGRSAEALDGTYTDVDSGDKPIDPTEDDITRITWTETVSNLGWEAGDLVAFRISRPQASASNLSSDMLLFKFSVRIPTT